MEPMKKKIIISGGAGFIGHHLVKRLAINNAVTVIDNMTRGAPRRLQNIPNVKLINADITCLESLRKLKLEGDVFFHLAAINGTENFYKRPIEVMDVGVLGIINAIKVCNQMEIKKLVVASSAEVYQTPKISPTPEDVELIVPSHTNARYSYGLSKIFSEFYSYHYNENSELSISIFRPHNVFGEDMGYKHVIPEIIIQFLNAKLSQSDAVDFIPKGNINATRAFCYVQDIIDGMLLISDPNIHGVYNIGSKEVIAIKDIINSVSKIFGISYTIKDYIDTHPGSTPHRVPDISKLSLLGYMPKTRFHDALKSTIDWYEKNYYLINKETKNIYM